MTIILHASNKLRTLAAGLAAALLLSGCAQTAQPTEPTPAPSIPAESTTEPVTLSVYVPDSAVERATDGAVMLYQLDSGVTGLGILGDRLLVCAGGDVLQLWNKDDMTLVKERPLDTPVSWADPSLVIEKTGIAWYDRRTGSYILLDTNLVNTATVAIGETLLCDPVISRDFSTIYYACAEGIKAMDVTSGITRMLRQEHGGVTCMDGLLLGDSLLQYTRRLEDGTEQTCFIATADGSSRHTGPFQGQLSTTQDTISGIMKLAHPMGLSQWILSTDETGVRLLGREAAWDSALLVGENQVVLQHVDQRGLVLDLYDLTTATMSSVLLPQFQDGFAYGCADGGMIWLCDGASGKFYGWNAAATGMDKILRPLQDAQMLDTAAFPQEMAAQVEALNETYGVSVTFASGGHWTEGMDYGAWPEYRPVLYAEALNRLEDLLRRIPGEFWAQLGSRTNSGKLKIVLTDDFDPATGTGGDTERYSVAKGDAEITVSVCADLEAMVVRQLWNIMEVRIRNESDRLNAWSQFNPDGFAYTGESQWESGALEGSQYLIPGGNWFADSYGMVSERHDRAQVLVYAMMDGQDMIFESEAMQNKLAFLCQRIRHAYKLKDDLILPWEQYLLPTAEA